MGYKLWTTNELLTSSDVNNYLMRQAVIVCTSGTRPSSPTEGMTIYETDTDNFSWYSGSGWVVIIQAGPWRTYTPTFQADGGSPTVGTGGSITGRYQRIANTVTVRGRLVFGTGASGGTGGWYVSLPVNARSDTSPDVRSQGVAEYRDVSTPASLWGFCSINPGLSVSRISLVATAGVRGTTPVAAEQASGSEPFPWTAGDHMSWTITYEAAA